MDRQAKGRWAEKVAAVDLEKRGYRVLRRNVRLQRGEIDLIAWDGRRLWFVEIKSRSRPDRGSPFLAINRRKRRAMFAAAREYVVVHQYAGDYGFLAGAVSPSRSHNHPCVRWTILPISPAEGCTEC